MSSVAARPTPSRRGGRRLLIAIAAVIVLVVGGIVWLNISASAAVEEAGALTVYVPAVSVAHGSSGQFAAATTGSLVQAGDSVKTDATGRASITLPDGSVMRLATATQVTLTGDHFNHAGHLQDASLAQQVGRTLTDVQHLVSGASFQVSGKAATATVRGTRFEVYVTADGTMTVKLFDGQLDFDGKNHVHLVAGEQATADSDGNVSQPTPIQPDPNDPFDSVIAASNAVAVGTTPGTEQDFIGPPLHDRQQQQFTYSYAGGSVVKASLGYRGSAMSLTVVAPDGQSHVGAGASPIVLVVSGAPAGIYRIVVTGVSGLGTAGEEPFVAVASVETCATADVDQNRATHRGYTARDVVSSVQISGMSNLSLAVGPDQPYGSIVSATGTYSGVSWGGTVLLVPHDSAIDVMAVSGTVFGVNVPAQQVLQQIGSMAGQDPSNVNPGFMVDRLFTCNAVVMIDGHHA